jgi:hypothetical protein
MPGILPMKVIKVGTSAQSRIAQACDRCRSKKIRCDGIRPCCSQCANVGFECKTSDKLSRRAFPRGYTESLEERVRSLEAEIRELKNILDEKDEKIDMLSRMRSYSSPSRRTSDSDSPTSAVEKNSAAEDSRDKTFQVQQSPSLLERENSDSLFMGASSGRGFIGRSPTQARPHLVSDRNDAAAFKRKVQETGKSCADFNPDGFFKPGDCNSPSAVVSSSPMAPTSIAPPRLVSDQTVNIFFQEWAPLFPVLHRPTFLKLYEDYTANPESIEDKQSMAQLNLVFGIAALSAEVRPQFMSKSHSPWKP